MTLEEARKYFEGDRFATYKTGIVIDSIGDGCSECSFEITPDDVAAHGSVMGGAVFTLADFAFAVAANSGGVFTVTLNSSISFVSMPKDKKLIAKCTCIKDGKKACFYETRVSDGLGNIVAIVTSNGIHI
ncbi:MAG: PaaI family thioesterase [Clostridia bacterium]|nr:PaaI family thioesterase [Clostridia bacterium]